MFTAFFLFMVCAILSAFYKSTDTVVVVVALSLSEHVTGTCGTFSAIAAHQSGMSSPSNTATCIPIEQWIDFSSAITQHASLQLGTGTLNKNTSVSSSLIFCPFKLDPTVSSFFTIEISHTITLICHQEQKCIIDSSKNGGNTVIRIKGPKAEVTFHGFVFQGAGKIFSAVHITYGVIPTQSFCSCVFQRNIGSTRGTALRTRGTALRTEPNTTTYIMKTVFQDNMASDMGGGIFNRGYLVVENSLFQRNNGTGSAIATSAASKIELKGNSFTRNNNGYPLYFQGSSFVNAGANTASFNALCNGIYDFNARSCIKFPSKSSPRKTPAPVATQKIPTPFTLTPNNNNPLKDQLSPIYIPTYNYSSFQHASCEKVNIRNQPCISVQSWTDFRDKIEDATSFDGQTLIFCPFTITRGPLEPVVYITNSVNIICAVPRQCRMISDRRHFMINGFLGAEAYMQGLTLEGATESSILFLKNDYTVDMQHEICNVGFLRNQGSRRGAAVSIEEGNTVVISDSYFQDNKSANVGGAIFAKGTLTLIGNSFINNNGTGSALSSSSGATVHMAANLFLENKGRHPVFLEFSKMTDMGGNNATDNNGCNGIFVIQKNLCVPFGNQAVNTSILQGPSPVKVDGDFITSSVSRSGITPRGGPGYFNYDPNDSVYGPGIKERVNQRGGFHFANNGWANVVGNAEYKRWQELSLSHNRSLANRCSLDSGQSPIDLCEKNINSKCTEHHQTRSHSGNVTFGKQVTAEILPSMLRLKYYRDRTPDGGPYPPEADFAADWNGYAEVNHIDVKIPSEHTICEKRFPAEYSVFMLHPKRRQTIVMSILMDFDPRDKDNQHFQLALDQWQATFDRTAKKCNKYNNRHRLTKKDAKISSRLNQSQSIENNTLSGTPETPWDYMRRMTKRYRRHKISQNRDVKNAIPAEEESKFSFSRKRTLTDNTPFGTGGWDPFHPSLNKSIYHWGYWGSLTEPPCATFFAIRVVTEPAYISRKQWNQMRSLLFNYKDEKCMNTSVDYGESVARPIQDSANRPLYKCTRANYVSDAEKEQIRIDTGNPKWCC